MNANNRGNEVSETESWAATTTGRVVIIALALVLALVLAVGAWWFISGGFSPQEETQQRAQDTVRTTGNPEVVVNEGTETVAFEDDSGAQVELDIAYPDAAISGVQPQISQAFADAAEAQIDRVSAQASVIENASVADCEEACRIESAMEIETQGIVNEWATVATRTSFDLGEGPIEGVFGATVNLQTGEEAQLTDLLDIENSAVVDRAVEALERDAAWGDCAADPVEYLNAAGAFAPTDAGVLMLWTQADVADTECSLTSAVVPWAEGDEVDAVTAAEDRMYAGAVNGTWCPAEDSPTDADCFTVDQLTAYWASTNLTWDLRIDGVDGECIELSAVDLQGDRDGQPGALGTFCPAGTASDIPDGYSGATYDDQDRIFLADPQRMLLKS